MSHAPVFPPPLAVWARLAAFLSFLSVFSALLAPVSMLAKEVRSGQLGGICSVKAASSGNPDSDSGDAPQSGSRCGLCGTLGWALPPLALSAIPCFAGQQVAAADFPADVTTAATGLPFSRGPPAL